MAHFCRVAGEYVLNLKDLISVLPPSGKATFSGLVGRVKRDGSDLLIPQGLFEESRNGTSEGMLILNNLVTGIPPSLRRLFEDKPFSRPLFGAESHQIPPFSSKNAQIIAENGAFPNRLSGGVASCDLWHTPAGASGLVPGNEKVKRCVHVIAREAGAPGRERGVLRVR